MNQVSASLPIIPPPDTTGPQDFGHGVTFEWIEGGRIAVFTMKDSTRASVDTFINVNIALAEQHRGKTIYIFNDAASPHISLTPYLRQKVTNLAGTLEALGITATMATLVEPGFFSTIAKIFGSILSKSTPHITQNFFNDRDEALDWLKAQLSDT